MRRYNNTDWGIVVFAAAILVMLLIGLAQPYFEARTFNRCTGGNATYFDALVSELRVMECNPNG